jgi:hypothetical protein
VIGVATPANAQENVTDVGRLNGELNVSAVIWCTGFRPAFDWIKLPVFERNGYPRHQRGCGC